MIENKISNIVNLYNFIIFYDSFKNKNYYILKKYLLTNLIVTISKKTMPNKTFFLRPNHDKECNCGYFNNKIKSKNGFPSGHMNTVSFFSNNYINKDKYNPLKVLLISSMGWARYKKKCHTVPQIIAGSILPNII